VSVDFAMTREEAGQRTIPFGKYRDLTVESVYHISGGPEYLEGLLRERSVGLPLKDAIRTFLNLDR